MNKKTIVCHLLAITVMVMYLFIIIVSSSEAEAQTENIPQKLITLELKDVDIHNALHLIAQECNVNIAVGPDVKGKVTVSFVDVAFEDALTAVLRINGYDYIKEGSIMRVIKVDPARLRESSVETEVISKIFDLKYIDATSLRDTLQGLLTPYGKIQTFVRSVGVGNEKTQGRSNILILTDTSDNIEEIEAIVAKLDVPSPQVIIDAKIVEVKVDGNLDLGIDWSIGCSITGSKVPSTFPFPAGNKKMDSVIPGLDYPGLPGSHS